VFVTWGDGQSTSVVTNGGPGAINASHQYGAAGNYTITVHVTDNDGGVTTETLSVVVTTTAPAAPTGLTVQSVSANQVGLGWTDNSNDETGFKIERCNKNGCTNFVEIGQVGPNVTALLTTRWREMSNTPTERVHSTAVECRVIRTSSR
jgi:PKD repeat protein